MPRPISSDHHAVSMPTADQAGKTEKTEQKLVIANRHGKVPEQGADVKQLFYRAGFQQTSEFVGTGRPVAGGPAHVLFDNTKDEQAGNADWVVFPKGRFPSPKEGDVTKESDWVGGISSWGYELAKSGRYALEQLQPGSKITYGDSSNPQDLSNYSVYVVPEPNTRFTDAEAAAMKKFVENGGGLFIVADHTGFKGADRNNDGYDPGQVWNDFFTKIGDVLGMTFEKDSNLVDSPDANVLKDPSNPILNGKFGEVKATTYYNGATLQIDDKDNASVKALIWQSGVPQLDQHVTLATAEYGKGRVVAIGDSSPADDGTGNPSDRLHKGWTDPKGNNKELFCNATDWLARQSPADDPQKK